MTKKPLTEPQIYAIDYGTSNSLIAACNQSELSAPLAIDPDAKDRSIFRSILFYPDNKNVFFGQKAIDQYAAHDCDGRLFRSIKKYLPNPAFASTQIGGRPYLLEDIISTFLREMKDRADKLYQVDVRRAVIGRPAKFSLNPEYDKLAKQRLERAALLAGFEEVELFPEPLAAAFEYRQYIKHEKILLVVDLGGGTSDFTVMKITPNQYSDQDVLAIGGISVAGDAMDGALMGSRIAPEFASKVEYKPALSNNILKMPPHIRSKLSSAPDIALMTEEDILTFIKEVGRTTLNKQDVLRVQRLVTLAEDNLGFRLFEIIEANKRRLGEFENSQFSFSYPDIDLELEISQDEYSSAVTDNTDAIMAALDETVKSAQLGYKDIDILCATGGTSKMPLIKEQLFQRVSAEKVEEFQNFHSVIQGLNRYAQTVL